MRIICGVRRPCRPSRWRRARRGCASSVVSCVISDDRRRSARLAVARRCPAAPRAGRALHDALERDSAIAHALGDRGHGARPVVRPRGARSRRPGARRAWRACRASGLAVRHARSGGMHRAAGDVEDVARRPPRPWRAPPAPGPTSRRLPTKSPSMATQLVTPDDLGDRRVLRHHGRVHALLDAAFGALQRRRAA